MTDIKKEYTTNKKPLNSYKNIGSKKRCLSVKKESVCDFCGGRLVETKDIVISKGKSIPIHVRECNKCGESFSSLKETERVRKELHPSIWTKIKNCFISPTSEIEFFKGKVL